MLRNKKNSDKGARYSFETGRDDDEYLKFHLNCKRHLDFNNWSYCPDAKLVVDTYSNLACLNDARTFGFRPTLPYSLIENLLREKNE